MPHLQYVVQESEVFYSIDYPQIQLDLKQILKRTASMSSLLKGEILVSFTKSHSLKSDLISKNPEFAKAITSGSLPTGNIELLFEASRQNALFRQQLEEFIQVTIS